MRDSQLVLPFATRTFQVRVHTVLVATLVDIRDRLLVSQVAICTVQIKVKEKLWDGGLICIVMEAWRMEGQATPAALAEVCSARSYYLFQYPNFCTQVQHSAQKITSEGPGAGTLI